MEHIKLNVGEFVGKKVVSMSGGAIIGVVEDVLINTDNLCATAFAVSGEPGKGALPFDQTLGIGPDAVTVETAEAIHWKLDATLTAGRLAKEIKGLPVVNVSGTTLGHVHEIQLFGDCVSSLIVRSGGVFGIGAEEIVVATSTIRSIGPKLVTVDVPAPQPAVAA